MPMPPAGRPNERVRLPVGLPPYLAGLYEVPILTRDQEVHLFRKMNYLKYKARNLRDQLDTGQAPGNAARKCGFILRSTGSKNRHYQRRAQKVFEMPAIAHGKWLSGTSPVIVSLGKSGYFQSVSVRVTRFPTWCLGAIRLGLDPLQPCTAAILFLKLARVFANW